MMETLLPEMILKKRVGKTLHRECAIVYIFNHLAVEGSTDILACKSTTVDGAHYCH